MPPKVPKATTRSVRRKIDLTEGVDWVPPEMPVRKSNGDDGVGDKGMSLEQMVNKPSSAVKYFKNGKLARGEGVKIIESNWHNILKCAQNGYEMVTIAKAVGITDRTLLKYLKANPDKRTELTRARLQPRDTCVQVILNAAKSGQWLPAAWWLERTCWQEFARPEVKLQLMDRAMNQSEVVQTFNGKSLQQINSELREKYAENENFQRAIGHSQPGVTKVRAELGGGGTADDSSEG